MRAGRPRSQRGCCRLLWERGPLARIWGFGSGVSGNAGGPPAVPRGALPGALGARAAGPHLGFRVWGFGGMRAGRPRSQRGRCRLLWERGPLARIWGVGSAASGECGRAARGPKGGCCRLLWERGPLARIWGSGLRLRGMRAGRPRSYSFSASSSANAASGGVLNEPKPGTARRCACKASRGAACSGAVGVP